MSLLEVNPLVVTKDSKLSASTPRSASTTTPLFRHPRDCGAARRDRGERRRSRLQIRYQLRALDGTYRLHGKWRGLAMATMDISSSYGESPANFLMSAAAQQDKVGPAFKIIRRTQVKGFLINIFGGIMKCDVIAAGCWSACARVGLRVPLVVRSKAPM